MNGAVRKDDLDCIIEGKKMMSVEAINAKIQEVF